MAGKSMVYNGRTPQSLKDGIIGVVKLMEEYQINASKIGLPTRKILFTKELEKLLTNLKDSKFYSTSVDDQCQKKISAIFGSEFNTKPELEQQLLDLL